MQLTVWGNPKSIVRAIIKQCPNPKCFALDDQKHEKGCRCTKVKVVVNKTQFGLCKTYRGYLNLLMARHLLKNRIVCEIRTDPKTGMIALFEKGTHDADSEC